MKIFLILFAVMELALILELVGKEIRLGFCLACVLVQMAAWFIFDPPAFEIGFLKENGWVVILGLGILVWFGIPWLKKEAARGDGGGMVLVEEDEF